MPSPIIHTTMGYVVYRIFHPEPSEANPRKLGQMPILLIFSIVFSLLPDVDSLFGILAGDFGRYHNNANHSLIVGLLVALSVGGIAGLIRTHAFRVIFLVTLFSYAAHISLDFFTIGRGVMALWPLSQERFGSPLPLFYGLHWSDGLFSIRHIWTFLTESATAALFVLATHYLILRKWGIPIHGGEAEKVIRSSEGR